MSKPITIRILGDSSGLEKALGKAQGGLGKFGKFAAGTALAAGAAVVGGLGISVKSFADFDAALNQSLAIMGDVSDGMRNQMSDAARQVAKTTTFSAKEAAESYFFLASAGMDAEQSIAALPQVAAFAQAGMFDMATATDLATDAQSALGLSSDDAGQNLDNLTRVTDVFVRANTLANTSVEQLAEAMTSGAGASAKVVGMEVEEVSAVLAAFADQGVKGAEAGTQFSIVLRDLQTKALANESAFEKAGVSVFDASGELRNMGDVIGDLEGFLDGMSDAEKKSALLGLGFSDKSVKSIQTLLGASDAIHEYQGALEESTGFTKDVAEKQLQTFNAQFGLLKDRLIDVAIQVGSFLVPLLMDAMDALKVFEPVLDDIGGGIRAFAAAFRIADGDITSAGFPGFMERIGYIARQVFDRVSQVASDWSARLRAAFDAVSRFIKDNEATFEKWRAKGEEILTKLRLAFTAAFEMIRVVIEVAVSVITDLWNRFGSHLVEALKNAVDDVLQVVQGALDVLTGIFDLIRAILTGKWGDAWDAIKKILSGALNVVLGLIKSALNAIKTIIGAGMAVVSAIWSRVWDGIGSLLGSTVEGIKTALGGMVDYVKRIPGNIASAASGAFDGLWNAFKSALNRIVGAWNGFQLGPWKLPKVSIPGVGDIGGGQIGPWSPPTIPYLAEGGVIDGPTLAMVGEYPGAARNPEIVTPEDKMRTVVREETEALVRALRDIFSERLSTEETTVRIEQVFQGFSTEEARALARKGTEDALAAVRQRKRSRR